MTNNQKERFKRTIEKEKQKVGRGGNKNLNKDFLDELAEMIKELFK